MKTYQLPIFEFDIDEIEGLESELITYNENCKIISWELRSPHCGGCLIPLNLDYMKEYRFKSWERMLEKIEMDLLKKDESAYHKMMFAKAEAQIDQNKDDKISEGA